MIEKSPLISIVMPVYNEDNGYLSDALESIFSQSFANFELIIVDDSASLINQKNIITNFGHDERLRYYRNDSRIGLVKSLNLGLAYSSGDYICRMDSDDIAAVHRLERQLQFLDENKSVDVVGSNINLIDQNGVCIGFRQFPEKNYGFQKLLHFICPISHPSVMFRRSVYLCYGGYRNKLDQAEDLDLWLRWSNRGVEFANIQEPLLFYRVISEKRPLTHWISNIGVRISNISWHMMLHRIAGIIGIATWMLLPKRINLIIYRYLKN